ncbi:hypothetical protein E2P81_ATG07910 [Venturia nashicola]|nr:hypothetical protein E2P81_ATG07910 [Venturia nashicola]
MNTDVELRSRFDVECRRSYYKEPGCRRRIKEMVALVMEDESEKKARRKAFAMKQLMLETEHLEDTRSTVVYFYAHHY